MFVLVSASSGRNNERTKGTTSPTERLTFSPSVGASLRRAGGGDSLKLYLQRLGGGRGTGGCEKVAERFR